MSERRHGEEASESSSVGALGSELPSGFDVDSPELELLKLSIDVAGVGTFDWDLEQEVLKWDDRLVELFGYDRAGFRNDIESFNERLHPEDLDRVSADLGEAIETCGEFESEYRIQLPSGEIRWVAARGRALCDERGVAKRLLGAAWDVTERVEGDAHVARVMESLTTAFFSLDRRWHFTYLNAEAERVLGRRGSELLGRTIWETFPAAVGSDFETYYRRAMETGESQSFDAYYPHPLDAWYEVRAWPNTDGLAVYFLDATTRRKEEERAARAARRTELLARITDELIGTLVPEEAVARLSNLVVPTLADWCIVTMIDDQLSTSRRALRDAIGKHSDPAMQDVLDEYASARLAELEDDAIVVRAIERGQPQFIRTGGTQQVAEMFPSGRSRQHLEQLAPESVAIYPLMGRNGPVGMLTLCNIEERGPFTVEDLITAEHVAARAGLVMDNARLYRQQRELAEGLQRSMLSAPPEPDHVQIIVRYAPAASTAQVGGDWYDAFIQPEGATVVVIGDVVGHDTQAAAAMGQLRSIVRTIGAVDDGSPARVLTNVDQVMERLQVGTTATVIVGRLEQTPDERDRGLTRFRWSNAGHPPAMIINLDGVVTPLQSAAADMLLGVTANADRNEYEVALDRGATVLMYTDGLVERRGQSLEDGLLQLKSVLEDLAQADSDLDWLCDQVLERMLPPEPDDDVALIALRLHRQDEPRPPEAGPNRIPPNVPNEHGTP